MLPVALSLDQQNKTLTLKLSLQDSKYLKNGKIIKILGNITKSDNSHRNCDR